MYLRWTGDIKQQHILFRVLWVYSLWLFSICPEFCLWKRHTHTHPHTSGLQSIVAAWLLEQQQCKRQALPYVAAYTHIVLTHTETYKYLTAQNTHSCNHISPSRALKTAQKALSQSCRLCIDLGVCYVFFIQMFRCFTGL